MLQEMEEGKLKVFSIIIIGFAFKNMYTSGSLPPPHPPGVGSLVSAARSITRPLWLPPPRRVAQLRVRALEVEKALAKLEAKQALAATLAAGALAVQARLGREHPRMNPGGAFAA